jgi:hypothetical protein
MHASTFFDGVRQADIDIDGDLVKLPIFYRDGESITGVFPARLSALRKMLPDRRLVPARLAPGLGAITITCFEYRDSDVGSYNELAIGIMLNHPRDRANLPGRALLGGVLRGQMDAFVHHLPVTTELALKAGRELWNYPKFVASIDFEEDDSTRTCRLAHDGEHILTMSVPKIQSRRREQIQLFTHVYQDGQPQRGEFKLLATGSGQSILPGAARLELGPRHPIAQELSLALLTTKSIAASYVAGIEGILFGPENINPLMIQLAAKPAAKPKRSSNGRSAAGAKTRSKSTTAA